MCVVETDCEVDFAPPKDYVEPDYKAQAKGDPRGTAAGAAAGGATNGASSNAGGTTPKVVFGGSGNGSAITGNNDDEVQIVGDSRGVAGASSSSASTGRSAAAGSGGVAGSGSAGLAPISAGGKPVSAAAAAALARLSGGGNGTPSPAPSKFAPQSKVTPFEGAGRRLGGVAPGTASPGLGAGTPSGTGAPKGSPQLTPLAGGVILSSGLGPDADKPKRSLNRFEQARAEKAFQGEGRSLRG